MKVKVKLSGAFETCKSDAGDEYEVLRFDSPVPVGEVLKRLNLPDDVSTLILVNGMVRNKDHVLKEGDTLSIFPTVAGG